MFQRPEFSYNGSHRGTAPAPRQARGPDLKTASEPPPPCAWAPASGKPLAVWHAAATVGVEGRGGSRGGGW
eukprot:81531-Rhodomonas_salina.2